MNTIIDFSKVQKPILIVGNGVRAAGASELLYEYARATHIPVLTSMNGVDLAQDDIHIGFIGTHGNRVANMIVNECDFIIAIGVRLGLRQVGRYMKRFAPRAKLIRVEIDENELARTVKVNEQKVQMDAHEFLTHLLKSKLPDYTIWQNKCLKVKAVLAGCDKVEGNFAVEKIASLLPENPIVAVDVGQHQCWSAQSLTLKGIHGRIFIGGGYGAMGCALPYAIGASIARQKGLVYCITGDGGLQMNIQELQTVKREKLPIKILVMNNRVLGKISETQCNNHNRRFAQTAEEGGYTVPDFQKIAEAYGIKSATLDSYKDLDGYADWFSDFEPCLLNINLSTESFLYPKITFETGEMKPMVEESLVKQVLTILK